MRARPRHEQEKRTAATRVLPDEIHGHVRQFHIDLTAGFKVVRLDALHVPAGFSANNGWLGKSPGKRCLVFAAGGNVQRFVGRVGYAVKRVEPLIVRQALGLRPEMPFPEVGRVITN